MKAIPFTPDLSERNTVFFHRQNRQSDHFSFPVRDSVRQKSRNLLFEPKRVWSIAGLDADSRKRNNSKIRSDSKKVIKLKIDLLFTQMHN